MDTAEQAEVIVNFTCFCKWNGVPLDEYWRSQAFPLEDAFSTNVTETADKSLKQHKRVRAQSGEFLNTCHLYVDSDGELRRLATHTTVTGGHYDTQEGFYRGFCCCDVHPSCCPPHSSHATHKRSHLDEQVILLSISYAKVGLQ